MIYNIKPLDFHTFFNDVIKYDIIDSLFTYKLLVNNKIHLKNKETKRLLSYFIIYHIIKIIKESKENKTVVVVQPFILNESNDFYDKETDLDIHTTFCKYIKSILKILYKAYPTNIVFLKQVMDISSKDALEYLFHKCNKFIEGNSQEFKSYTLENFSNTRGL